SAEGAGAAGAAAARGGRAAGSAGAAAAWAVGALGSIAAAAAASSAAAGAFADAARSAGHAADAVVAVAIAVGVVVLFVLGRERVDGDGLGAAGPADLEHPVGGDAGGGDELELEVGGHVLGVGDGEGGVLLAVLEGGPLHRLDAGGDGDGVDVARGVDLARVLGCVGGGALGGEVSPPEGPAGVAGSGRGLGFGLAGGGDAAGGPVGAELEDAADGDGLRADG